MTLRTKLCGVVLLFVTGCGGDAGGDGFTSDAVFMPDHYSGGAPGPSSSGDQDATNNQKQGEKNTGQLSAETMTAEEAATKLSALAANQPSDTKSALYNYADQLETARSEFVTAKEAFDAVDIKWRMLKNELEQAKKEKTDAWYQFRLIYGYQGDISALVKAQDADFRVKSLYKEFAEADKQRRELMSVYLQADTKLKELEAKPPSSAAALESTQAPDAEGFQNLDQLLEMVISSTKARTAELEQIAAFQAEWSNSLEQFITMCIQAKILIRKLPHISKSQRDDAMSAVWAIEDLIDPVRESGARPTDDVLKQLSAAVSKATEIIVTLKDISQAKSEALQLRQLQEYIADHPENSLDAQEALHRIETERYFERLKKSAQSSEHREAIDKQYRRVTGRPPLPKKPHVSIWDRVKKWE